MFDPVSFNACGKSFIYIKKRSSSKIDPLQFISPACKKTFSSVTKNFLFERYTETFNH